MVDKYLDVLGRHCVDKVTGLEGIAESVSFDLYGCVQVALHGKVTTNDKGEVAYPEGRWIDINRLEWSGEPVMRVPSFELKPQEAAQDHSQGPARSHLPSRR